MIGCLAVALAVQLAAGTVHTYRLDSPEPRHSHRVVRVYLPPSYDQPGARARRYPVIFLLHGWPGSDGNWIALGHADRGADTLIAAGRIPEVILVFPNGTGSGLLGRSLWIDSYDGSSRVESFLTRIVVPWVDATFRTRADARHRGVIGLSDGGTAAFNLVLRHPDLFGAAGSHSGTFRLHRELGMGGVIGPEPGASAVLERNSPAVTIERDGPPRNDPVLYFDCGLADENLEDNRAFHRELDSLGVRHTYREFPGTHDWRYWRAHLPQSLEAVTAAMR